jgi:DNA-directed RNA polymerase subunit M/transcription elongation factor TFIIS
MTPPSPAAQPTAAQRKRRKAIYMEHTLPQCQECHSRNLRWHNRIKEKDGTGTVYMNCMTCGATHYVPLK